jgi:hypothetical protein
MRRGKRQEAKGGINNQFLITRFSIKYTLSLIEKLKQVKHLRKNKEKKHRLFGLCHAMYGSYKGWNPYIERHLAIFVNCFLSKAD